MDIQEDLITTAKDKLRDLGEETPDIEAKDVAREVFEEMFRNMEMLDLGLEHYMEMIEISTRIYDVKDGQVKFSLSCGNYQFPPSSIREISFSSSTRFTCCSETPVARR